MKKSSSFILKIITCIYISSYELSGLASNRCQENLDKGPTVVQGQLLDQTPIKEEKSHRNFAPLTESQLKEKIVNALKKVSGGEEFSDTPSFQQGLIDYSKELNSKLTSDLAKVEFESNEVQLDGFKTLDNGLIYYGFEDLSSSGIPTYYIIYWDGKALRGYIPTAGNLWNTKTKTPYGENGLEDILDLNKRFPSLFSEDIEDDDAAMEAFELVVPRLKLNKELMDLEIKSRISNN